MKVEPGQRWRYSEASMIYDFIIEIATAPRLGRIVQINRKNPASDMKVGDDYPLGSVYEGTSWKWEYLEGQDSPI
jgi:hypothetical protein